jgi:polysaccharide biosynthesis protein PslJ
VTALSEIIEAAPSKPPVAPLAPVRQARPTGGRALTVAILGFPIFWALGLSEFVWIIVALPMAYRLWLRPQRIRVPPFFGLWMAFLVWVIAGGFMIGQHLPGTLATSGGYIGWGLRVANLLADTVVLLYVGNLRESDMPTSKIVRLLGVFFCITVAGGLLGTFLGGFSFSSPFELILPHGIRANYFVHQLIHPGFAQVQDILGKTSPRPKAPFAYTNYWGNDVALLLIWFVVAGWIRGSRRARVYTALTLVIAAVPIIYSLNRGVWIGLGLSLLFLAFQLARRGRLGLIGAILGIVAVATLLFTVTPLKSVVDARLSHPQSNTIRGSLDGAAFDAAVRSPIVGWGTTRSVLGSPTSIAIGKTSSCQTCGNAPIGSTGELWTLLIANGFVGAGLYLGFILLAGFRYRHDRTPEGVAARLILYLAPFYALFYSAETTALAITFISLGLLWRNEQRSSSAPSAPAPPAVIVLP